MTRREAAIISAYTGVLIGHFSDLHAYIEEKMGREVYILEITAFNFPDDLRNKVRDDFLNISFNLT